MRPPAAGPTALEMLNPALLTAMALGNSSRGTSSGTIPCQVGPFIADPTLRRNVRMRSDPAPIQPVTVNTPRMAAAATIQLNQKSSR